MQQGTAYPIFIDVKGRQRLSHKEEVKRRTIAEEIADNCNQDKGSNASQYAMQKSLFFIELFNCRLVRILMPINLQKHVNNKTGCCINGTSHGPMRISFS